MSKRTFTKQQLQDILWEEDEASKIILNEMTDSSRWSIYYRFIFEKDGKLYETSYSKGATEQQDESPWEYEDETECVEVEAYEMTVIDYRSVKNEVEQQSA